jgi:hypothetical protein
MRTSTVTVHLETGDALAIRPTQILAVEDAPEARSPNCQARVVLTRTDRNGENICLYVRETVRAVIRQLSKLSKVVTVVQPDYRLRKRHCLLVSPAKRVGGLTRPRKPNFD